MKQSCSAAGFLRQAGKCGGAGACRGTCASPESPDPEVGLQEWQPQAASAFSGMIRVADNSKLKIKT
jgi:hypothetical protein